MNLGLGIIQLVMEYFFSSCDEWLIRLLAISYPESIHQFRIRENNVGMPMDHNIWLQDYNEIIFFQLFRMKKATFHKLHNVLVRKDTHNLIKKKYRGGRYPIEPEKSLLIFLWYLNNRDTLIEIADRFDVVASSVMNIVNAYLFLVLQIKKDYIFWPQTLEEFDYIRSGFRKYPGTIGAVDGCHIELKVSIKQQDSYIDRSMNHSINLMAICTSEKIFSYVFIGFPGSAHDSRVFSNSTFYKTIERYGPRYFFPDPEYHIIGDSAFPLKQWLITPYKKNNLLRHEAFHNFCLSSDRVCIENVFGLLKGRYSRLKFINTYSVSKAIEIVTAACVLHNFCYKSNDYWQEIHVENSHKTNYNTFLDDKENNQQGRLKRDEIAQFLITRDG